MVQRLAALVAVVTLLLVLGIALMGYLAYDIGTLTDTSVDVHGLRQPARILLDESGTYHLEADSELDAYRALGYLHGRNRSWGVVLLRQTALGKLGDWFGSVTLDIDRFTQTLGLSARARSAYDLLEPNDRAALDAYASGLNSALSDPEVRRQDEFVLLDVHPGPWEPWHALAIERLLAWLSVPELEIDSAGTRSPEVVALARADVRLRQWLRLHDFDESLVWLATSGATPIVYHRLVSGSSALPLYQSVVLRWAQHAISGLTVPGWPVFYVGQSAERSWVVLPTSHSARLSLAERPAGNLRYERLRARPSGEEELIRVRENDERLMIERRPSAPHDTLGAISLNWPGLAAASDWTAWRALQLRGVTSPGFGLIEGAGVLVEAGGAWSPLPSTVQTLQFPGGVLITRSSWRPALELLLRPSSPADSGEATPAEPHQDVYSAWAAERSRALLRAVDSASVPISDPVVREALTLLRNWNARYDVASLGASVFEHWLAELDLPPDSLHAATFWQGPSIPDRAVAALPGAVELLVNRHGSDPSVWRWENVQPRERVYPVFSDTSLAGDHLPALAHTRYAPLAASGPGHPSVLMWRPSLASDQPTATSAWSGWTLTDAWTERTVQQDQHPVRGFLGRYLDAGRRIEPYRVHVAEYTRRQTLTLRPPS